jgi:hypothetical protein
MTMMRPKQFFGVVLRAMGVWCLGGAVIEAMSMVFKLDGVPTGSQYTWQYSLMYCAGNALVGLVMLLGADGIVRFAYRENHEDEVERF